MSLIRLKDDVYVNPEDVACVVVNEGANQVRVFTRNDDVNYFPVPCDYGKGVYATLDRVVGEINEACMQQRLRAA